jgi:3-oxoacyl-[acyl-carrier-protein] synthase-3
MPSGTFQHARIAGVVTLLPANIRSIEDEVDLYGGNAEQIARIRQTIGLGQRRVVSEGRTALDLCEGAARPLLVDAGVPAESLDSILFVTQTPDHFQPANACILHGRLGATPACAAMDINLGCSGWVYALWLAYMMVEIGQCRRVLVLAGDTISRQVNPRDRSVAPLFGDAGSATLVERCEEPSPSFFSLHTDGSGHRAIIVPGGAFRQPPSPETRKEQLDADGNLRCAENLHMAGGDVFNFTLQVEPAALREIEALSARPFSEVDYVFFHQANRYIISNIARRLKLPPEKVPSGVVEKWGNQSSASIPSVMCDTLAGRPMDQSLDVIVSGFGVGLSWATARLRLDPLRVCRVIDEANP